MWLEKTIQEIKKKKELKYIDNEFVKSLLLEYIKLNKIKLEGDFKKLQRTSQYKKMFKEIRRQCRTVYGSFQDVKDSRNREVYERIFNEVKGNSILDIGCGEAPLDYLSLHKEKTYYLTDIDTSTIAKIQKYIKKNKIKGKAFTYNIIAEDIKLLPKADTVLLLKVLEGFEAIKRDITFTILKELQAKKIVISFAKIALGKNKKIKKSGRQWLRKMLNKLNYKYTIGDIGKEIFFFIDKE